MSADPMSMMLLLGGLQNFSRNIAGNAPPGGQQTGAMGDIMPALLQMQRLKAEKEDLAFRRDQSAAERAAAQAAAEQKQAAMEQFAREQGVSLPGLQLNPDAITGAYADNLKGYSLDPGQRRMIGADMVSENPALLDVTPEGTVNRRTGASQLDPARMNAAMQRAALSATRVTNNTPVKITQDTLSAKLAETPAAMFRKVADAGYEAQSALDATRAIYEMAKLNPDLFGPGMKTTAEFTKAVEAAKNLVKSGGQPDEYQRRLLAVDKAVDIRQTKSAVAMLRDIGGNDTEKEYERVKNAIPGLETSLPAHEVAFIQEKTAADYLSEMSAYAAQKVRQSQEDRSLGITTVDDAIREYKQANPLGERLAKDLDAVMRANGMAAPTATGAGKKSASAPPPDASADDLAKFYNAGP